MSTCNNVLNNPFNLQLAIKQNQDMREDFLLVLNTRSNFKPKNNTRHFYFLIFSLYWDLADYYVKNDLKNAKNIAYVIAKLYPLGASFHLENKFPFFFALLSDNKKIIEEYSIISTDIKPHPDLPEYEIGKLEPRNYDTRFATYALQCVIKQDWDEYHKIKELVKRKIKKLNPRNKYEFEFYDLLEHRDTTKIKELINLLLTKRVHKTLDRETSFFYEVFAFHPTLFTKLCWMNGLEIEIDNSLVPMNLMPIEPLEEYDLIYDFLKPDYDWEAGAKKAREELEKMEKTIP